LLKKNPYTRSGLSLLITGVLVALSGHFILSISWITALGISMLILAFILLALARTIPRLSPEVSRLLLDTSLDNMASIIEELGIKTKAIYLPSSMTSNHEPRALVPLHTNSHPTTINRVLPKRFIVRYGASTEDIGLLMATIGSNTRAMLQVKPEPTSESLETALASLFGGVLGTADKTSVSCTNSHIRIELGGTRIENETNSYHDCLGSPLASIAATIAAEAWNKPIIIRSEENHQGICLIELEITG